MSRKKIHVLHLIKGLDRGGAEILLSEGLKVADRDRFSFSYSYFLTAAGTLVPNLRDQGVEVTCFGARSNVQVLSLVFQVARHLKNQKVDVVHAHLPLAGVVARLAGRIAGVPVVYTEHCEIGRYHPVTKWLNLRTWGWQNAAVAVSADVACSLRQYVGDVPLICTVLNGVDTDQFDGAGIGAEVVKAEFGIPRDSPVVGTIAVFRSQKRLDNWLQVAKIVSDKHANAHFLLVGDGAERAALEEQVYTLGIADVVHFAGRRSETRSFFAAMDVYLITSEFEGLPIALLEAMSMGKPTVATSVGGIPEAVGVDEQGRLRSFGDLDGLAQDVSFLLEAPLIRDAMGRAARQRVIESFSLKRMQAELEAIYMRVLGRW